jgi:hypothetical protein
LFHAGKGRACLLPGIILFKLLSSDIQLIVGLSYFPTTFFVSALEKE